MKHLMIAVATVLLFGCGLTLQQGGRAVDNVKAAADLVKKLADAGVPGACRFIAINKCTYGEPCEALDKCHDLQDKILQSVNLAVMLANKAMDLLAAGDTAGADMYALAALEVLAETQKLLKLLGINI